MEKQKLMLKSEVMTVWEVNKKTTAAMFKNLKVGSKIKMWIEVDSVGTRRGGTYAPVITIMNVDTGERAYKTFNEIEQALKPFVLITIPK